MPQQRQAMTGQRHLALLLACLLPGLLGACRTQRILAVDSVPAGALVRFDEEIIGKTPLEHEFVHYGQRRLSLYLPGYQTWSEPVDLTPPLRARFPIDILTELLLPLGHTDRRSYQIELIADTGESPRQDVNAEEFFERAWARHLQHAPPKPGPTPTNAPSVSPSNADTAGHHGDGAEAEPDESRP